MPERTVMVFVFGEPHPVTVEQKSKSVWVAVGEYKGESIQAQDQSEGSALAGWREAAEYKTN